MALTQEQMGGLWGDGGPYSQVRVTREIRILDDGVSRTFYYVHASVNPTTYAVLKEREAQIEDEEIQAFLKEATFVSDEEGYEWHVYGRPALSPRGANRAAAKVTEAVARMHHLVMETLQIEPPKKGTASEAPPGEAADRAPDSEPDGRENVQ